MHRAADIAGIPAGLRTRPEWRNGDAKAYAVARWIAAQAVRDATHPDIERAARQAFNGLDGRDARMHAVRSRAWMQANIRYTKDPITVEQVETPRAILRRGVADCDGSVLQAALLLNAGQRVRVVLWGPDESGPFTHVFVDVLDRDGTAWTADWVARDAMLDRVGTTGRRETFPVSPALAGLRAGIMVRHLAGETPAALEGLGEAPDPAEKLTDAIWQMRGKLAADEAGQIKAYRAAATDGAAYVRREDATPQAKWGPALPLAAGGASLAMGGFVRQCLLATAPTLALMLADFATKAAFYGLAVIVAKSADPSVSATDPLSVLIGLLKAAGIAISAALQVVFDETRKLMRQGVGDAAGLAALVVIGLVAYNAVSR